MGGSSGGGAATARRSPQARQIDILRLGQEKGFDPFRQQAQGMFGNLLNPYGGSQGGVMGMGSNQTGGGSMLPGMQWSTPPTPNLPGTLGTPAMTANDLALQALQEQTGREGPFGPRRLPQFIKQQARRGITYADQAAIPGHGGSEGTPGILSQNPADMGMRAIYDKIPGMSDLRFSSPEEAFAASRLASMTDVSGLESAAARNFDQIVGPGIQAQLTAGGMGRQGAYGEAASQAGAQMALPIALQAQQAQGNLAQYIGGIGQNRNTLIANTANPSLQGGSPLTTIGGSSSGGQPGSSVAGTIGAVGGALGGFGTLATGLAALFGGSSRIFKENIAPLSEDEVMSDVRKTPIYTWNYKGSKRRQIGTIIEEAPKMLSHDSGLTLDPINYLGMLHVGLKNIDKRLSKFEAA